MERRKASACLSRIGRAVTSVQANEKEREADSNAIKEAVKPLLHFQPEAGGGSVADDSKGEGARADRGVHHYVSTPPHQPPPDYALKPPPLPLRLLLTKGPCHGGISILGVCDRALRRLPLGQRVTGWPARATETYVKFRAYSCVYAFILLCVDKRRGIEQQRQVGFSLCV